MEGRREGKEGEMRVEIEGGNKKGGKEGIWKKFGWVEGRK